MKKKKGYKYYELTGFTPISNISTMAMIKLYRTDGKILECYEPGTQKWRLSFYELEKTSNGRLLACKLSGHHSLKMSGLKRISKNELFLKML